MDYKKIDISERTMSVRLNRDNRDKNKKSKSKMKEKYGKCKNS